MNQALRRASGEPPRSRDIQRSIAAVEIKESLCRSSRKPDLRYGERPPGPPARSELPSANPLFEKRRKVAALSARPADLGHDLVPVRDENANPAFDLTEVSAQVVFQILDADSLDGLHGANSSYG